MSVPFVMGLNLGPVEDPNSMVWMKVIIMFPALAAIIHLLIFIFIFPSKTPAFLISQNKIKEAESYLDKIYPKNISRSLSLEI